MTDPAPGTPPLPAESAEPAGPAAPAEPAAPAGAAELAEPAATRRVGVVTVTYSPGETLAALLDSLPAASTVPLAVVISDNGSDDGSVEAAERRPDVTVVHNGRNLGYGGGVNAGVGALPAGADPVLIVNPDVVLGPGALDELLAGLRRHPEAGAVGPLITTADGVVYPSARQLPSLGAGAGHALLGWCWPGNPWTRTYRQDHAEPVERKAGWLSGSCLLVRRNAFAEIGGFDDDYFMYFEDVDLGDRLARAGWVSMYVPSASVTHLGGHAASRDRTAMSRAHHASAYRYLSGRYARPWQAPVRWALRLALAVRAAAAARSAKVAGGAELPDRRSS